MQALKDAINRTKQSYYLDFESDRPILDDQRGKTYDSPRDIKRSQKLINRGMERLTLDHSYRDPGNNHNLLEVDAVNSVPPLEPYNRTGDNIFSFWGINNSNQQSVQQMTPEYLAMKQAQEKTQLEENAHNYAGLSDELKFKQAMERQMYLEKSNNNIIGNNNNQNQFGGHHIIGVSSRNDERQFSSVSSTGMALNAQGQWMDSNPQNYLGSNKYAHLKQMSPEMMNIMQGKPIAGDVAPPQYGDDGDVFSGTSIKLETLNVPDRLQKLRALNESSQRKILGEKAMLQSSLKENGNIGYSNY